MTMLSGCRRRVKIFIGVLTLYGGRIRFTVLFSGRSFHGEFVIGGYAGCAHGDPPGRLCSSQQVCLIAHVLMWRWRRCVSGVWPELTYWFPKAFGFTLNEGWQGRCSGLVAALPRVMPITYLGLMGATRRCAIRTCMCSPSWSSPWQAHVILVGIGRTAAARGEYSPAAT